MEISIISRKENPLLEREEITFIVDHDSQGTPSLEEVRNKLAAVLAADIQKLYIKSIKSEYGVTRSKGTARLYKTVERAKQVEQKHIIMRNLGEKVVKEKKKKEAAKPAKAAGAKSKTK